MPVIEPIIDFAEKMQTILTLRIIYHMTLKKHSESGY